ncbi:MAG: omptin family outer membrane protease [bacterium]
MKKRIFILSLSCLLPWFAHPDDIYLKDGSVIKGKVIEAAPGVSYKIRTADGSIFVFLADEVERISFEEGVIPSEEKPLWSHLSTKIGLKTAYLSGKTIYHISFDNPWDYGGHGESELEFPMNNYLVGIDVLIGKETQKEKGHLGFRLLTNIDKDAGIMKDSDWIENDAAFGKPAHSGRDCYTESDAELSAIILDFVYVHHPFSKTSLSPILGLRYQRFRHEIYGAKGSYWDEPVSIGSNVNVLEYEVKYWIPYLGISSDLFLRKNFNLNLVIAYSGWVSIKDEDHHLLRNLAMKAETEGEAYLIALNSDWQILPQFELAVGGEYMNVDTSGMAKQYVNEVYNGSVKDKITSNSYLLSANVSYRF